MPHPDLILPDADVPDALRNVPRILGYAAVAAVTPRRDARGAVMLGPDGQVRHLVPSTISSYFHECLDKGWTLMPPPDYLLLRTPGDWLPGWLPSTVLAWPYTRPGPGNRTRGANRRGGISTVDHNI